MAMRTRVLAGCFAFGVAAFMLTGTVAQATPLSAAQGNVGVSAAVSGQAGGNVGDTSPTPTPTCSCQKPSPSPTPTCTCQHPSPPPTPTPTCTCQKPTPTPTPTP